MFATCANVLTRIGKELDTDETTVATKAPIDLFQHIHLISHIYELVSNLTGIQFY